MRFNLRKLELLVVWIHVTDLVSRRGAEDLDNLDQLVNAAVAGEDRLAEQQLGDDAPGRPNVC